MSPPLHACKLSAVLCLLFLLPSLFFSLILFSLFSFFLFLPIACILSSLYLLSAILIRVPNLPLGRILSPKNDHRGQDCVDLNSSEIPRLDDSSEEEEEEEEEEEKEEENREELERFQQQFIVESGGYKSFYEILSFWRSKERKDSNRTNC